MERPAPAMRSGASSDRARSTAADDPVVQETRALFERYLERHPEPTVEYDADWPSPCEVGHWFYADPSPDVAHDSVQLIRWQPQPRWTDPQNGWPNDFDGLEAALEVPIHPDFKALFSHWSATLELNAPDGHVSLLQLWNPADAERYIENLIGHILVQRRACAPLTLFFACTEPDSELILSLDNASGAVVLEQPGRRPERQVAGSLADFLATLEPAGALTL
ncbi:MAG: SecY-interacting protein Syd [Pseudomonadota bacterium]